MSVAEHEFKVFGDKAIFALEVRHIPDSVIGEDRRIGRVHGVNGVCGFPS